MTGWPIETHGAGTLRVGASPGPELPPPPPLHLSELHSGHQRAPDSALTRTWYPGPCWGGRAGLTPLVPPSAHSHPARSPQTPPRPTGPHWPPLAPTGMALSVMYTLTLELSGLQVPLPAPSHPGPEPAGKSPNPGTVPGRVAPATFMLSPSLLPALGRGADGETEAPLCSCQPQDALPRPCSWSFPK